MLDAPLPAHWRPLQRIKNHIIYVAARGAYWCVGVVPYWLAYPFAVSIGWLGWLVDLPDRRRALRQLAERMPELTLTERRRTVRRMFVHLAVSALEGAHMRSLLGDPRRVVLEAAHRTLLDEVLARGNGVVAATGHIGNWELTGQALAAHGYPITSIAKPVYDPRLTRWIDSERTQFGARILWRGDASVAKEMLRVFKNRGLLAMLIDQDTNVQGAFVPFFGRPAFTPTAAASLALRTSAPVIVGWSHRKGGAHILHFEELRFEPSGDKEADTVRLTALISERLEAAIREAPEQWVWLHDRWKRQPGTGGSPGQELDLNTTAPQ